MLTNPDGPIRLLIAEASENRAHELDSLLRDAGIATRAEIVTDIDDLNKLDSDAAQDMIIWRADFGKIGEILPSLKQRRPDLPIIVLHHEGDLLGTNEAMALGATDVVDENDNDHLLHVVKRELDNVCQRHRLVQTRRALKEAEQRCELLLSNSEAAIAYVHEGMHIYANDAYYKLFGFVDADEMLGLPLMDLLTAESAAELKTHVKTFRQNGEEITFSFGGQNSNKEPLSGQLTLAAAEYEGEACLQVSVLTEAQDPPEATVQHPVVASASTGALFNLDAYAANVQAMTDRLTDGCCAVAVIEIDNFDNLQADVGIATALEATGMIGNAIEEQLEQGVVARIATHRFAAAWLCDDQAANHIKAEQIRARIESDALDLMERSVRVTVSVAVTTLKEDQDAHAAADAAFKMLMSIEDSDGNRVYWDAKPEDGDASNGQTSDEAQRILGLINNAIDNQTFVLLFQPIISLRGDSDEHYEVFLRLPDESGDELAPAEFLKLAIEHGVAAKIDRWVILQSIKLLSVHRSKGNNTRLTINVTSNSLRDKDFIQWLGVAIRAARLPSDAVIFQITEQDAATHLAKARTFVEGLKKLHCRASLGRFGTTDTPFETLRHLPVEFVKLDGERVLNLDQNEEDRVALTEMIRTLQSNGKLTIVPMVESATVLSALWQAGANYIQGHYLQEPSPEMNYDFTTDDE